MRDRTKLILAGTFLALAIVVWVGTATAAIHFYYQKFMFQVNREIPAKEKIDQTLWKIWTVEDELAELKDVKNAPAYLELDPTAGSMLEALDAKIQALQNDLENERRDIETYKQEAEESLSPFEEALQQFNETREDFVTKVGQARDRLSTEREAMEAELESEKERIATLDSDIRTAVSKIAQMEDVQRKKRIKLLSEYQKYRKLLDNLIAKRRQKESGGQEFDGKVLLTDLEDSFVILDLGSRHRVRKGMTFEVFGVVKGVLPIRKGLVEVRDVGRDVSYARIVKVYNKENPIQAGDMVANKLFKRQEKLVFVLVGSLRNFNRAEFIRFVTEMGDEVKDTVDTDTSYLIVGAGVEKNPAAQEQIKLARELGVKIITEKIFLDLVSYR